jgi:hypothetical protein
LESEEESTLFVVTIWQRFQLDSLLGNSYAEHDNAYVHNTARSVPLTRIAGKNDPHAYLSTILSSYTGFEVNRAFVEGGRLSPALLKRYERTEYKEIFV